MRLYRKVKYSLRQRRKKIHWGLNRFERFVVDVIYSREKSSCGYFLSYLLLPFSWVFSGIVRLRYWLYKKRIFDSQQLGCHVIVVGNITMGGTGKTPIAEYLAKLLQSMGRHPAIISRGYKSKSESKIRKFVRWVLHLPEVPPKIVSDCNNVILNSDIAGDEPYMLAKNLPGVPVVVDKDRIKAGRYAIKVFNADVLVLDDGFQYFKLRPSLSFVLIDNTNPFGNKSLIPRGILREPISHLKRASCIIVTKSDGHISANLKKIIKKYDGDDIVECCHQAYYCERHIDGQHIELEAFSGKNVAVFSGIASPASFEKFIDNIGANIVYRKRFIDHHRFSDSELQGISERSSNAECIITTEKDAVRIPKDFPFSKPLYFLRVGVQFLNNEEKIKKTLEKVLYS